MKIVIITSLPNSTLIKKISDSFDINFYIVEQRKSISYIARFYYKRFKKRPIDTILEIFYQIYKAAFLFFNSKNKLTIISKANSYSTSFINSKTTEKIIREKAPDIILLFGTSIIKKNIFNIASIGTINIHTGINPKYRGGGNPWAFINNDFNNTGYTIHFVDSGIDTGKIIRQEIVPIPPEINDLFSYTSYCLELATTELIEIINDIKNDKFVIQNFESQESKYYPQLNIITYIKAELSFKRTKKYYYELEK